MQVNRYTIRDDFYFGMGNLGSTRCKFWNIRLLVLHSQFNKGTYK